MTEIECAINNHTTVEGISPYADSLIELLKSAQSRIAELEKDCCQLIDERDERDEVIDALMAEVLGGDCNEWSSAYGFNDAVVDVECRMKELEKDAAIGEVARKSAELLSDSPVSFMKTMQRAIETAMKGA